MTIWFYPIDWATTGSWMQAWAGFAGAGAVVWAARLGTSSFEHWLKQRQTERKIAAGERILSIVYRLKDAMDAIRSPMQSGHELHAAERKVEKSYEGFSSLGETEKKRIVAAQVILDRVNAQSDLWKELFECLPLARAFYGKAMDENLREVWRQRARVLVASEAAIETPDDHEFLTQCKDDMWDGWAKAAGRVDRVGDALSRVLAEAEARILPVLSPDAMMVEAMRSAEDHGKKIER